MEYHVNINGIDVDAIYSDTAVKEIFFPILKKVTRLSLEKEGRVLVLVAAPPGAGKSTLVSFLEKLSRENPEFEDAKAIGMDGFHRRQEYLESHKTIRDGKEITMAQIKGAPETFDLVALKAKIEEVLTGENVGWPSYDRLLHNPVEDAIIVDKKIVLLEGNYLLLNEEGWKDLREMADLTIFIKADGDMLRDRLIARKAASGHGLEKATAFVDFSDMANVRLCLEKSEGADIALFLKEDNDYCLDKDSIRKNVLTIRNGMSDAEITDKSKAIIDRLFSLDEYKKAENILVYASMGSEVMTDDIILDALSKGKQVFCPKVTDKAKREMKFVKIENLAELKKGYFGIREPIIEACSVVFGDTNVQSGSDVACEATKEDSLVIMPGVAFDRHRNRLGYGGGFYDTFLEKYEGIATVALGFDKQIYAGLFGDDDSASLDIVRDEHDIKPDMILTENGIIC